MDKKRKNWMSAIRRATAHQVSSGCVSLGTKSLIMKDPAAFSLIRTGITSTAPEKFVSETHVRSTNTANVCLSYSLCVFVETTFVYFTDLRKMA